MDAGLPVGAHPHAIPPHRERDSAREREKEKEWEMERERESDMDGCIHGLMDKRIAFRWKD